MNLQAFEFNGDPQLSLAERIDLIRQKGLMASAAFPKKYAGLMDWYKEYSQLYILSFCMFYFMLSKEGYDEEAETGKLDFSPYYMEVLQAFALTIPLVPSAKPLNMEAERFKECLNEVGELINLKHQYIPEKVTTEKDLAAHMLRTQMMTSTIMVRNWSYDHLMRQVTKDICAGVKKVFRDVHGCDPGQIIQLLYAMTDEVEKRVNRHLGKVRGFMEQPDAMAVQEKYEATFTHVAKTDKQHKKEFGNKFHTLDDLKFMLMMHSDLQLEDLFTFSVPEMVTLAKNQLTAVQIGQLFDHWSLEFGELRDDNKEYFLMTNPVQQKPFIKLNDQRYFSSLWTVMSHLSLSMLEGLFLQNKRLNDRYQEYRSQYLEEELWAMCAQAFPGAKLYRGSKWLGQDGKDWENDLIIIVGSFALVIEAKSGQVSPPAKRGAPDRLHKTLRELVEDPAEQALRFIEYLKANKGVIRFKTKKPGKFNEIDTTQLKFFIPLGITLSHLGALSANQKFLIDAGVTERTIDQLAPSMNLTDLKIVFDLLPSIPQKFHYFQRRREIESHLDYFADEVDLLAWYMECGFAIGKIEYEKGNVYHLTLKSKDLDAYIIGVGQGKKIARPEVPMTDWWKALLHRLESTKMPMWLENSFLLRSFDLEIQKGLEEMTQDLIARMRSGQGVQRHNWILMDNMTEDKRYVIIAYPYTDEFFHERNAMIDDIFADEKMADTKGMLLIGINIDKGHYPYSVLTSKLSAKLFDQEFQAMVKPDEEDTNDPAVC